jgi:hypothetical protein
LIYGRNEFLYNDGGCFMKILHRYAFSVTSEIRQKLSSIGIDIPDEKPNVLNLDIPQVLYVDESDKNLGITKSFYEFWRRSWLVVNGNLA